MHLFSEIPSGMKGGGGRSYFFNRWFNCIQCQVHILPKISSWHTNNENHCILHTLNMQKGEKIFELSSGEISELKNLELSRIVLSEDTFLEGFWNDPQQE